jgi:hypothetical protein
MADIVDPKLTVTKGSGPSWTLTVKYTAVFTPPEVNAPNNFVFRDAIEVWEDDPISDDYITVGGGSVFNPNELRVPRTISLAVHEDALDTELGEEEIFAKVRLRNVSLNVLMPKKKTNTVHFSP